MRRGRTTTCIRSHMPALSSSSLITCVHIFFVHYLINVVYVREPEGIHAISWVELSSTSAAVPTCIWMSFAASHRISSAVHDIGTALDVL